MISIRSEIGIIENKLNSLYRYRKYKKNSDIFCDKSKEREGAIILTHLGNNTLPSYVSDCIEQIRIWDQDIEIYFACDCKVEDKKIINNCIICKVEQLGLDEEYAVFLKECIGPRTRFSRFFQMTLERFFVVERVIDVYNLKNVIHLENDVLLYENASRLINKMKMHYSNIAVPKMSDRYSMASIMYIPNQSTMKFFLQYINKHIFQTQVNDMFILSDYLKENINCVLPSITKEYVDTYDLINLYGEEADERFKESFYRNIEKLGGIFDPAEYGQYIGGIDKIHCSESIIGYINPHSFVNPSKLLISWKYEKGKLVPCVNSEYKLINLHIHSKELVKYRSDKELKNDIPKC